MTALSPPTAAYEPGTLSINMVTRGRPWRAIECVRRILPNIALESTRLIVSVDDDDQQTLDLLNFLPKDDRVIPWVKPREDSIGEKYNRVLDFPSQVYTFTSDYCAFSNYGFDKNIIEAANLFPDRLGVVFSHMANFSFAYIHGLTHELTQKLGYFYPPYFPYWFVDHWIDDLAKLIDRISFADVQMDSALKLPTQELRDLEFWTTFFDAMRLHRRRLAREIIDSPEFLEPEWRKEILRRHYPLIEYRSQWINDTLRAREDLCAVKTDGGERYNRLKAKALKMLVADYPDIEAELTKAA